MPRKPDRIRPFRERPGELPGVQGLLNLGPKSAAWLAAVGITTLEEVRRLGPVGVCQRLRAAGHPVSVVMAYALEGALSGCPWNAIPGEAKQQLRMEFVQMKREADAGRGLSGRRRTR